MKIEVEHIRMQIQAKMRRTKVRVALPETGQNQNPALQEQKPQALGSSSDKENSRSLPPADTAAALAGACGKALPGPESENAMMVGEVNPGALNRLSRPAETAKSKKIQPPPGFFAHLRRKKEQKALAEADCQRKMLPR